MAQNISLWGASYSNVPSVKLPKTGGGTAQFDDTIISSNAAAASDITSGKLAWVNGTLVTGTNSGGGGGATNIVMGTFTTGTTGNTTGTATINYTGTGYPIALMVFVKGGAYNNSTSGNTTWYNSMTRYDCGWYSMIKARTTSTPTYTTSGADNYGTVAVIYKNSTSSATSYTRTSTMTANVFSSSSAAASTAMCRFKGNGKTLSYYIGNATSSTIGFPKSTEMQYIAIYSS